MPLFHPGADARDGTQTKFIYPYKTPERFKTNPSLKRTPSARDAGESREMGVYFAKQQGSRKARQAYLADYIIIDVFRGRVKAGWNAKTAFALF